MRDICEVIDKNKKYYIYGIAGLGKFAYNKITETFGEDIILGFIQTSPETDRFCGKKVYSVRQAAERITDTDMIILAAKNWADDMRQNLLSCGISENAILDMEDYWFILNFVSRKQIKNILLWPSIEERNLDLTDKIKWFAPDRIQVRICSSNEEVIADFSDAGNVEFINQENVAELLGDADYIYVWDASQINESLNGYMEKVIVIDPNFNYQRDIAIYGNTYFASFTPEEKEIFTEHSKEVMAKMQAEFHGNKRANVFCTGPSIGEIYDKNFDDDINIICNSMIKDRELMEKLQPKILTFGDVAFYLSPNQYCQAFYKDLLYTFEKYQYYIIVYDYQVPLVKYHFPMLYDRLIGIKNDRSSGYHFPDSKDLCVRVTRNICTLYMLPAASSICDEIGLAGCTGRNVGETYFWEHNPNTQYKDLMHYVFEAYPAFFKYSNYEDYYEEHCQCIKELIEYGESLGKKYVNLTTSFIPALKERTIKGTGNNG